MSATQPMRKLMVPKKELIKQTEDAIAQLRADYARLAKAYKPAVLAWLKATTAAVRALDDPTEIDRQVFNSYNNRAPEVPRSPADHIKRLQGRLAWLRASTEAELSITEAEYRAYTLGEIYW